MILEQRINLLAKLGEYLLSEDEYLHAVIHRTNFNNQWLSIDNCKKTAKGIASAYLTKETLLAWARKFKLEDIKNSRKVGVVPSGNVPLVGLIDLISIFLAGHQAIIKPTNSKEYILPHLIKKMLAWEPAAATYFQINGFLKGFDAIIAMNNGGQNRYYETYFSKFPHIIRENRHSVAVLDGEETDTQIAALGNDVFANFGLGSENVSKIYVPEGYDFDNLLKLFHEFRQIVLTSKYKNNFDYNYSLFLLNNVKFLSNGCILLMEDQALTSRIACLHYEYYTDKTSLRESLQKQDKAIRYIVSRQPLEGLVTTLPGNTQTPSLKEDRERVETMQFLINL